MMEQQGVTHIPIPPDLSESVRPPLLRLDNVRKQFGQSVAVADVSLDIKRGEFFALLGPSGCGKSTLLRIIAGLEEPDGGRLLLDGVDVVGQPPHRRPVNMMFQSYALFPHMTVERNIAFGLRQERVRRREIAERVAEMLALVQLEELGRRWPHQLSGGQRQRVALARALIKRPKLLLLDEPLAALDKKLRQETQEQLSALQRRLGATFVIVTHDQDEAMMLADRIAVMREGRIAQVGTPIEIYEKPNSRYVASFIGDVNLIEGTLARRDKGEAQIDCGPVGYFRVTSADTRSVGQRVTLATRPEKLQLMRTAPLAAANALEGTVQEISYRGERTIYRVRGRDDRMFAAAVPNLSRNGERLARGEQVWATWSPEAGILLDP
jgi:putrescine transport system ATP-binding protein